MNVIMAANAPWAGAAVAPDHRPRQPATEKKISAAGIVLDDRARTPPDQERKGHQDQSKPEQDEEADNGTAFAAAVIAQHLPPASPTSEKPLGAYPEPSMGKLRDRTV